MPEVRIRLSVLHAAFDDRRRELFAKLYETLLQECEGLEDQVDLHIYRELTPRGGLPGWLQTLQDGVDRWNIGDQLGGNLETDRIRALCPFAPTHLTFLPDDVRLGKNFVRGLLAAVRAQPDEVICGLATHPYAPVMRQQGFSFYRVLDAFGAFAGTLPVAFARDHLLWRDTAIEPGVKLEGDQGVYVHLMNNGRSCLKTLPSLVDHIEADTTLDGACTDANQPRRALVFEPETDLGAADWSGPVLDVGRQTAGQHWRTLFDLKPAFWDIEHTYHQDRDKDVATKDTPEGRAERHTLFAVEEKDSLLIVIPEYRGMNISCRNSLFLCAKTVRDAGIPCEVQSVPGHSLITRARNIICHVFMRTKHTILFQWDDDVECKDPEAILKMIRTGHDIIGGAYPFRDGSGGVVVGPMPAPHLGPNKFALHIDDDGSMRVRDVATGFLLVRRHVLADLMQRHPELLCQIDAGDDNIRGGPHWALFDTALQKETPDAGHRRRYLSEDWTFSRLARAAGYDPRVFVPPILRHWGETGFDGHLLVKYEFNRPEEIYGVGSKEAAVLGAALAQAPRTNDQKRDAEASSVVRAIVDKMAGGNASPEVLEHMFQVVRGALR